jgi:hypothetical protein
LLSGGRLGLLMLNVDMRAGIRIALLAAPFLVVPPVAMFYTHLNIGKRMFVERFGCGCEQGFNTNFLSLTVACALLGGAAASWWFAARGLSRARSWALLGGFVSLSVVFFHQFMHHNLWL